MNQYNPQNNIILRNFKERQRRKNFIRESCIRGLTDNDIESRIMAVTVLGDIGDERSLEVLLSHLNSKPLEEVRLAILDALSDYTDGEKVLNAIRSVMNNDSSSAVREKAKEIINQIVSTVRMHLTGLSQKISEQIAALTQTQNLAVATLNRSGARLHKERKTIECQELAEFGYEPSLLSKTELDNDTLRATIQVFKAKTPVPIELIFKAGDKEKMQTLGEEKQRAEFVFEYKKDQQYEIYLSPIKEKGIGTKG